MTLPAMRDPRLGLAPVLALLCWMMLLCLPALGWADQVGEDPTESRAREIAKQLRCAVCQNQSVYESNSDLAKDMLRVIRDKVRQGESDSAINDYFFQRYGDYIYLEPTRQGGNWLLWAGPFLALVGGGAALWGAVRRWRGGRGQETPPVEPSPTTDPALQARIRQVMDEVEL